PSTPATPASVDTAWVPSTTLRMVRLLLSPTSRFPEPSPVNPRGPLNRAYVPAPSLANTSSPADPAKVETVKPAALRELALTVKVTDPLVPPNVDTVIPEEPAGPRSTTVPVIDVVLMDEMPRPRPFNVPVAEKNVPPGTKFVPFNVTLSIWPVTPDDGVIPDNVGGATDEMRHATRWS